ncbi:hypothetical protein SAMN05421766_10284 [Zobellia uliginosa]|uniref:Uncharacterized protein n=1 Tax=Zobellia uliginosa TaxID=143224 RepID=A0ABY1KL89_9FLAO|nr:hypothetical protein SAMN05421766_10284 [Zobellia uliginosa]
MVNWFLIISDNSKTINVFLMTGCATVPIVVLMLIKSKVLKRNYQQCDQS